MTHKSVIIVRSGVSAMILFVSTTFTIPFVGCWGG